MTMPLTITAVRVHRGPYVVHADIDTTDAVAANTGRVRRFTPDLVRATWDWVDDDRMVLSSVVLTGPGQRTDGAGARSRGKAAWGLGGFANLDDLPAELRKFVQNNAPKEAQ